MEETGNLSCETCQKEFRNAKALDAHVRNAHPDAITKAYHCAQCNTSFRFKEAMETHMENVHGTDRRDAGTVEPGKADEEKELDLVGLGGGEEEEGEEVLDEEGQEMEEDDGEDDDDYDGEGKDEVDEEALHVMQLFDIHRCDCSNESLILGKRGS